MVVKKEEGTERKKTNAERRASPSLFFSHYAVLQNDARVAVRHFRYGRRG